MNDIEPFKKLDPQIKERFLVALRSGEYPQAQRFLRRPSGFCCLGVLCDLYSKEYGVPWGAKTPGLSGEAYPFLGAISSQPTCVCAWAGLDWLETDELIRMNDSGHPFSEIADWVEKHL